MTLSERIYRLMLRAYPARYREKYAEPMACCFRDQLRQARTASAFRRLWARTLCDWVCTVPRHRLRLHATPCIYSESFRQSIFCARAEASSFSRREITVEHLLLGLLRQDDRLAQELGPAKVAAIVRELEEAEAAPRREPPMEDLRLSVAARRVYDVARFYGMASEDQRVELKDLRRAILADKESLAARILRQQGIS
jgi:hypothetical protein